MMRDLDSLPKLSERKYTIEVAKKLFHSNFYLQDVYGGYKNVYLEQQHAILQNYHKTTNTTINYFLTLHISKDF